MKKLVVVCVMSILSAPPISCVASEKAATGRTTKEEQKEPAMQRDRQERKAQERDTKARERETTGTTKEDTEREPMLKLPNPCNETLPPSWCK
jgi:Ni/Co efflux regulator RcnB